MDFWMIGTLLRGIGRERHGNVETPAPEP